jgi:hypothetical protein
VVLSEHAVDFIAIRHSRRTKHEPFRAEMPENWGARAS